MEVYQEPDISCDFIGRGKFLAIFHPGLIRGFFLFRKNKPKTIRK
jgi:hypothetical protein